MWIEREGIQSGRRSFLASITRLARTLDKPSANIWSLARRICLTVFAQAEGVSLKIFALLSILSIASMLVPKVCNFLASIRNTTPANSTSKRSPFLVTLFIVKDNKVIILVLFFIFMHTIVISNFKGVNFVDKKQSNKLSQEIPCALHGSHVCPNPKECDGIHRLCSIWKDHSGR